MQLKDTIKMMNSKDYKERFKAEYYQLSFRLDGLTGMLIKWENNTLDFEHTEIESLLEIENRSYLLLEEIKNNVVICKKCGLKDYIKNITIKFS